MGSRGASTCTKNPKVPIFASDPNIDATYCFWSAGEHDAAAVLCAMLKQDAFEQTISLVYVANFHFQFYFAKSRP